MNYQLLIRAMAISILLLTLLFFGITYATAGTYHNAQYDAATSESDSIEVDENAQLTVVTIQRNGIKKRTGAVAIFDSEQRPVYYNDTLSSYWDVDPVENTDSEITYVATEQLGTPVCESGCRHNVIERLNLSTGEVTRLYSHRAEGGRWHDVDQINESHFVVADFGADTVFIVNTTSGIREWTWTAQSDIAKESGGDFSADWTHLNDVEYLDDGRIMISLRNQDRVVFVNQETGIIRNRTLGEEDNYEILYEQHNPDYIPAENGGPAVLVADSENNRVVEYRRTENQSYVQSWIWRDEQLQWPRDADRLPNGNTLITDSNGHRVLEVNEEGEKVWSIPVARPYEAEKLSTGAESEGGRARQATVTQSKQIKDGDSSTSVRGLISSLVPTKLRNGIAYILPLWAGFQHAIALSVCTFSTLLWFLLELRWSSVTVSVQWPIRFSR